MARMELTDQKHSSDSIGSYQIHGEISPDVQTKRAERRSI